MVSLIYTQTQMFQQEVYLLDRLDNVNRASLPFLRCICYIRPSLESIDILAEELRNPKYAEYYIYFSNILSIDSLQRLSESDVHERVKDVVEYYGDYYAINNDLFSFNLHSCMGGNKISYSNIWDGSKLERTIQGLSSVCLSLRIRPILRYDRSSEMAFMLARQLEALMQRECDLFTFPPRDVSPLLLILDRRTDPITPLLSQWTYQAMVHELLGINNGRVILNRKQDDNIQFVLNAKQDEFFAKHMIDHFGDLGLHVKSMVDKFQEYKGSHIKIESLSDMKRFMEDYPKFKEMSNNMSKHVDLLTHINNIIQADHLMEISELEQNLAVPGEFHYNTHTKKLCSLLKRSDIKFEYKIRLVILHMLKYRLFNHYDLESIVDVLPDSKDQILKILDMIRRYAIVSDKEYISKQSGVTESIIPFVKSVVNGLKGIDNIYAQHRPQLDHIIDQLLKDQLKDTLFPYIDNNIQYKMRPQQIILFYVNGATFEESRFVYKRNMTKNGFQIILGGTTIHSSSSFIKEITNKDAI